MISRTLCRMLCAFSKFHFPSSPVLSGRFRCKRSKNVTAFSCSSGSSASETRDWREAIFQSMHWMRTSTISLLGSATCGKPCRQLLVLALSIAVLMSLTWYMPVYISISARLQGYVSVYTRIYTVHTCIYLDLQCIYQYIQWWMYIWGDEVTNHEGQCEHHHLTITCHLCIFLAVNINVVEMGGICSGQRDHWGVSHHRGKSVWQSFPNCFQPCSGDQWLPSAVDKIRTSQELSVAIEHSWHNATLQIFSLRLGT